MPPKSMVSSCADASIGFGARPAAVKGTRTAANGYNSSNSMSAIGQSIPRKEGRSKVTGLARYVDDLSLPGMLYGATVRSPVARGIIKEVSFDRAFPWDGFTIVRAADIPGDNVVALITDD